MTSLCGIFDCDHCQFHTDGGCDGCTGGNLTLIKEGKQPCYIYECVINQEIESCLECQKDSCPYTKKTGRLCPLQSQFAAPHTWKQQIRRHLDKKDKQSASNQHSNSKIPEKTILRTRWYLVALDDFEKRSIKTVSSWEIAKHVGVKPALVRKDLSFFGELGTRNVGYHVHYLRSKILHQLHLQKMKNVAWLGVERLLEDPSLIAQLHQYNCTVVSLFDKSPALLGKQIASLQVMDLASLPQVSRNLKLNAGVIALGEADAQWAADHLVNAGVKAILNLTCRPITVPDDVELRNIDLSTELFALSYYAGASIEDETPQNLEKLLVVDPDDEYLGLISVILKRKGYYVIRASSVEEGLEMLKEEKPDLVLLSCSTPGGMKEFYFVWKIRGSLHPLIREVPILVLRPDEHVHPISDENKTILCTQEFFPVQAIIDKPRHPEELIEPVEHLLHSKRDL